MIGRSIRTYRLNMNLSVGELSRRAAISDQQLHRIENGHTETGIMTLLRLSRELGTDITSLIPKLKSEQEQAEELWEAHGLAKQLPGSAHADYRSQIELLRSMKLWVPPSGSTLTRPYARAGLIGELRNKRALNRILAELPDNTRMVRIMAISGMQSMEGPATAFDRLATLVSEHETTLEFLLLSRDSKHYHQLRSLELNGKRTPEGIADRIKESIDHIRQALGRAQREQGRVQVHEYHRLPIFRVVFIDKRSYVTFFPLHEGDDAPILIFDADKAGHSFYWSFHRLWHEYRRDATNPKNIEDDPREVYDEVRTDAEHIMRTGSR